MKLNEEDEETFPLQDRDHFARKANNVTAIVSTVVGLITLFHLQVFVGIFSIFSGVFVLIWERGKFCALEFPYCREDVSKGVTNLIFSGISLYFGGWLYISGGFFLVTGCFFLSAALERHRYESVLNASEPEFSAMGVERGLSPFHQTPYKLQIPAPP